MRLSLIGLAEQEKEKKGHIQTGMSLDMVLLEINRDSHPSS